MMIINKKMSLLITIIFMSTMIMTGCGSSNSGMVEGKVNVMTSFYPLFDFTQKIGGEHVNVINLIPAGVDSHDWTPKTQDMANITDADLLIYNGLGFEGWVENFLGGLESDSKLVSVEASRGITAIEGSHDEDDHDDHGELDPHVWLSPLQAKKMAENVKNALIQVDSANQSDYEKNYGQLIEQLDELHYKFEDVIAKSPRKDIVVSHEAYGYLVRDYDINQIGIMGISPNAEPTPQDMKRITDFVKEKDIKYILFEELVSPKLAQTLADDAGIETLVFNPLEGLTNEQIEAGEDYISMMEINLTSIEKALQ